MYDINGMGMRSNVHSFGVCGIASLFAFVSDFLKGYWHDDSIWAFGYLIIDGWSLDEYLGRYTIHYIAYSIIWHGSCVMKMY